MRVGTEEQKLKTLHVRSDMKFGVGIEFRVTAENLKKNRRRNKGFGCPLLPE